MRSTIEQRFPIRRGDEVTHACWSLDLATAALSAHVPIARLAREAGEMAEHFPRWLLTLVRDGQPVSCRCAGLFVFDRGVRCVQCGAEPTDRSPRAGWFGVLPPIGIDGLVKVRDAVVNKPPRRHVVGTRAPIGTYLLVPLVVSYPAGHYPRNPVEVYYLPEFRDIAGIPRAEFSHEFHMIGMGKMCLFAPGDWHESMTCRETLQQRAYPHAVKFLNYANGKRNAFAIVS